MTYQTKTTFWEDFSIADNYGLGAIQDTYNRAFKNWKNNTEYVTELVMVLNWKCFEHYKNKDRKKCEIYSNLYYELDGWCLDNLKGEDLKYYLETTD